MSPTGSDSGDGSINHPFATLQRAQLAMEGSSSIKTTYVEGGTYYMNSPLQLGNADSGTSFIAYSGATPILDGSATGLNNLITLNGANNVTISGLTFHNTASGNAALLLANGGSETIVDNHFLNNASAIGLNNSSNNLISGNEIDNAGQTGIEVYNNSNYNVIESNLVNGVGLASSGDTGGGGIFLHGANNNTISNNLVENTGGVAIGILNWDNTTINLGNTVSYNQIVNANDATASSDSGAIYILGRSQLQTGTIVNNNYIYVAGAPGAAHSVAIYLDDYTSGVTVTNNIVADPGTYAVQIHGGTNDLVKNNIFDLGNNTQAIGLVQGLGNSTDFHTDSITNNIVYSSATNQILWDWLTLTSPPVNSNNLYWNTAGGTFQNTQSWESPLPFPDSNPQFGNPNFVNPAAGNYSLGAGTAAGAISFQPIDQTTIGLHPTTAHWYT